MCSPSTAKAQQDPNYAPPPMFDDMTPPMMRPKGEDGYIVTPKASSNTELPEAVPLRPPVILPRVSVDPNAPQSAPAPAPQKQVAPVAPPPVAAPKAPVIPTAPVAVAPKPAKMAPIVEETYIKREKPAKKTMAPKPVKAEEPRTESVKKPEATPAPAKPVAPVKAPAPAASSETQAIKPVQRDPSKSAIQGPKTMPALPTESVDEQVLFDSSAPPPPETIMERHAKEVKEKKEGTLTPIVPAPNPNVTPASFDPGEQGVLKKTIPFEAGQIGLPQAAADPIIAGVVKELDNEEKADWRVRISGFATPHGTGLSSDRRIALSRALSLRSSMITQGVPASKIDVTAEGLQSTGGKPADRIDLYLYGPAAE